jgi:hypothetical protein
MGTLDVLLLGQTFVISEELVRCAIDADIVFEMILQID